MDRPEAQEMTEFRGRSELTAGPIKKFRFIKGILPKLLNRPLDSLERFRRDRGAAPVSGASGP
jgi:hypothetical protein